MGNLVYSSLASLDGYIADEDGKFDWAAPDVEVHSFVNDLERPRGTHLYGRRMYEVLTVWEDEAMIAHPDPPIRDFAEIWRAAEKVVYSRTLDAVSSGRTRIEREFEPEAVRALKAASERDLSIGGAELAAQALAAGLVDEIQLLLSPVVIGGGKPALPDRLHLELELLDQRRFGNGVVYLHYRL